ncbi:MAG TPA: EcsC family protein [Propionibacteriaceae bacterium]|nr:EcsC family protein [Propionibacteriaceae bacterium]
MLARGIGPVAAKMAPQAAGGALRRVLEMAIDGLGPVPSAKQVAGKALERQSGSVESAIESIVESHVRLASAQGFVANLGGVAALPVAVPANVTGMAVLHVRMIAAIAHLRGYDVNDNRVRTALVMCLLGGEQIGRHIAEGKLPTSPMAVATAPVFDPDLDRRVAEEVVSDLTSRIGGKNLALMVTKRVPLIGGGVGAVMDGLATRQIGKYAQGELALRRQLHR